MFAKDEERFQLSNKCCICNQLFDVVINVVTVVIDVVICNYLKKVRDHCHITGKYRGSVHWGCNINLKLTKKVPIIFHNLSGYDSHLIMKAMGKFNVKVSVIPNGLEKYMTLTIIFFKKFSFY